MESDKTLIAASDLLVEMQAAEPHTAKAKLRHAKALQNLMVIIENTPTTREAHTATPTVSPSKDATSPKVIKKTQRPPTTETPQHAHANNKLSQRALLRK